MPVDQAIAHVKSMAKDGVAPLVDLYAMLNQYQRLQQQQVRPPQTPPTIRDQVMASAQQAPMQAPMAQGLGGLDSGVMENAQFAGGGIVAFEGGGDVQSFQAGGATWEMNLIRELRARGLPLDEINRVVAEERAKRDVALGKTAEDRMPYETERKQAVQAEKPRELDEAKLGGAEKAPAVEPEAPKRGWATPDADAPKGLKALGKLAGRATGVVGAGMAIKDLADISKLSTEELRDYYGYEGEGSMLGNLALRGRALVEQQVMPKIGPFSPMGAVLASGLRVPSLATAETRTPVEEIMSDREKLRELELQEVGVTGQRREMPVPTKRAEAKLPASKAMSFIDSAIKDLQKEGPDALTAEQSAEVAKKLTELPDQRRKGAYLALAQAGFSMAEAASKPGAKFMGALGAGGKEASRLLTILDKDLRDVENDLRKEMFAIEREGARITRDRENRIMDLNVTRQKMQEDRDALAAQLGVRREELGVREREAAATRGETAQYRTETLASREIASDPIIQALSMQAMGKSGQDLQAIIDQINARRTQIRSEIETRMGTASAAAPTGTWGNVSVIPTGG
jgi:DNA-binding transcriptional MerR regulator